MKLSTWVELVGIIALVLSLVFVGFELRQANNIALTAFQSESATDLNEFHNDIIADEKVAALLLALQKPDAKFSDVDQRRAQSVANRSLNRWYSVYLARQNGIVDDALYEFYRADVAQFVRRMPGLLPYLRHSVELMGLTNVEMFRPIFEPGEPFFGT